MATIKCSFHIVDKMQWFKAVVVYFPHLAALIYSLSGLSAAVVKSLSDEDSSQHRDVDQTITGTPQHSTPARRKSKQKDEEEKEEIF